MSILIQHCIAVNNMNIEYICVYMERAPHVFLKPVNKYFREFLLAETFASVLIQDHAQKLE